jgi:hypothetical protein
MVSTCDPNHRVDFSVSPEQHKYKRKQQSFGSGSITLLLFSFQLHDKIFEKKATQHLRARGSKRKRNNTRCQKRAQ